MKTPRFRSFSRLLSLVWLLAAVPLVSAQEPPKNQETIIWGADKEGGGPYLFIGPTGELIGYELEIIQALEQELKRKIQFQQYDFASLIPGLSKGDLAIAMNGLEITPERRDQVLFTRPYYIYRQQLVTRKGETRFDSYQSSRANKSLRYGTMEGTAAERLMRRDGIDPSTYPAPTEAYRELILGRIDAVVLDLPMANFYAKKDPQLQFTGEPFAPGEYAIALARKNTALRDEINAALGRMLATGKLRGILEKWNLWDDAQGPLEKEEGMGTLSVQEQTWTFATYFPMLLQGALITIALTLCSFALAVGLGLPLALARVYGPAPVRFLVICHIEFFRGIPVYLLLLLVYFGLPEVWSVLNLPPFVAAMIGLGLNYSAYEAEIYRSALQSVPPGQWEAALGLGMDRIRAFRRIILPQAFRKMTPLLLQQSIILFQDTSLVYTVGLVDFLNSARSNGDIIGRSNEFLIFAGVVYFIISFSASLLVKRLQKRFAV